MDAGPIWATRRRRSRPRHCARAHLYNGPVADAAIELIREVVAKAADPTFRPEPLDYRRGDVTGRLRPTVRRSDRQFSWSDHTDHDPASDPRRRRITRCPHHARGPTGSVFDAHVGRRCRASPAHRGLRRHGAVLVRTGDGGVWVGQVRPPMEPGEVARHDGARPTPGCDAGGGARRSPVGANSAAGRSRYRRHGDVGVLTIDFYNGAMSTGQCRRLARPRCATPYGNDQGAGPPRRRCVLQRHPPQRHSRRSAPAAEAWRNITAIDDVCREIITCTSQLVVSVGRRQRRRRRA